MERYLSIQRRANALCSSKGIGTASYFQSAHDPNEWMEVYRYVSQATCRVTTAALGQEPEIMALWQEFQQVLDPNFSMIVEEFHERAWFSEPPEGPRQPPEVAQPPIQLPALAPAEEELVLEEEPELVLEDDSDLVPEQ
jgi:hypothetical protein